MSKKYQSNRPAEVKPVLPLEEIRDCESDLDAIRLYAKTFSDVTGILAIRRLYDEVVREEEAQKEETIHDRWSKFRKTQYASYKEQVAGGKYSDFLELCSKYWKNLSKEEKLEIELDKDITWSAKREESITEKSLRKALRQ